MIGFNKPYLTGKETDYILEAHKRGQISGDGHFTSLCSDWLGKKIGSKKVLLTHSCSAALEMAAILADIKPGDEVIMPSYTFVSTANAFVLRGGIPVFVDIREDTLNINEKLIKEAITPKTKAIVPVHYAGISCEMDTILKIAREYNLLVIEDAAQGIMSTYKGRPLGSMGDLGCFSFHETKNIISGQGGCLLVNNSDLVERAEIIREKGTDRSQFFRGIVDKYSWIDMGSSFLMGELVAAFLWAQLEEAEFITSQRLKIWQEYKNSLENFFKEQGLRDAFIPEECEVNGHMYYLIMRDHQDRDRFIEKLNKNNINSVFHYIPLHSSKAGNKYGRTSSDMEVTNEFSKRLLRLPVWLGLNVKSVVKSIISLY